MQQAVLPADIERKKLLLGEMFRRCPAGKVSKKAERREIIIFKG